MGENQLVAISFTDIRRLKSYQLKGKAKIYKSGKFFDICLDIMEIKKLKFFSDTKIVRHLNLKLDRNYDYLYQRRILAKDYTQPNY